MADSKQENKPAVAGPNYEEVLKTAQPLMIAAGASSKQVSRELGFTRQHFKKNPKLEECTAESVKEAVVMVIQAKTTLNPSLSLCHLVPRETNGVMRCILDFDYRGLIDILHRAGAIKRIGAAVVYEDEVKEEKFSYDPVMRMAKHVPIYAASQSKHEARKVYGAYSTALLTDGTVDVEFMPFWELEKVAKGSRSSDNEYSPHKNWKEEMYKKTTCRRHFKWLPKNLDAVDEYITRSLEMDLENNAYDNVKGADKGPLQDGID